MPGCLRALDVISIAAEPMMTKGEADPGLCVWLGSTAFCGEILEVTFVCLCFTVTGYLWDRF